MKLKKIITFLLMITLFFAVPLSSQAATVFYPNSSIKDNTPSEKVTISFIDEKNKSTNITSPKGFLDILKKYNFSIVKLILSAKFSYVKTSEKQVENAYYLGSYEVDNLSNKASRKKIIQFVSGVSLSESTTNSASATIGMEGGLQTPMYTATVNSSVTAETSYSKGFEKNKSYGETEEFDIPAKTLTRFDAYHSAIKRVGNLTISFKTKDNKTLKLKFSNLTQYSPLTKDVINLKVTTVKKAK
jgi:hypothetical protein